LGTHLRRRAAGGVENDDPRHGKEAHDTDADGSVAETQPVRAFPNALLEGAENLPIALSSVKQIPVDVAWTYGLGDSNQTSTDEQTLEAASKSHTLSVRSDDLCMPRFCFMRETR